MGEKIALGFHTCVDYELIWDKTVIESVIREYDIRSEELKIDTQPDSERGVWVSCLAHLRDGSGGEIVPSDPQICEDFAARFQYRVTLGGTSTRAALAMEKIGYSSVLQMCCFNQHIKKLLPSGISYYSSVGETHDIVFPHISLTYNGNITIDVNDIHFTTKRENRVLISRDIDSQNMVIKEEFYPMIEDAEVFLMSCFSQMIDRDLLLERMKTANALLSHLKDDVIVIFEDGCYVEKEFRYLVHKALAPRLDILSMNEDELQEYIEKKIDILNVEEVVDALQYTYSQIGVKNLIVHSAKWALAYGSSAGQLKNALEGAVTMAATRFQYGDNYGIAEYKAAKDLRDREESVEFCRKITEKLGNQICCVPCKDLSFVENPTVVGLGDSFVGGLLPGLLKENRM